MKRVISIIRNIKSPWTHEKESRAGIKYKPHEKLNYILSLWDRSKRTKPITCTVHLIYFHLLLNQGQQNVSFIGTFFEGNKTVVEQVQSEIGTEHIDITCRREKTNKEVFGISHNYDQKFELIGKCLHDVSSIVNEFEQIVFKATIFKTHILSVLMKIKSKLCTEAKDTFANEQYFMLIEYMRHALTEHPFTTDSRICFSSTPLPEDVTSEQYNIEEQAIMGEFGDIMTMKDPTEIASELNLFWNFFVFTNCFERNIDDYGELIMKTSQMIGHYSRYQALDLLIQFTIAIKNYIYCAHKLSYHVIDHVIPKEEEDSTNTLNKLPEFFTKVFNPNYQKAMILAICGHSNSGKTHLANCLLTLF
ncbi:MAG: hypothetical protein RL662_2033 [Bacteroidota bacterium]|jgi:hypothetical protein